MATAGRRTRSTSGRLVIGEAQVGRPDFDHALLQPAAGDLVPDRAYFAQGARFAVSRAQIRSRPKAYYEALRELGGWLGQAAASITAVLDPQVFAFGGGVA